MKIHDFFDGIEQKGFLPGVSGCLEHFTMCYGAMRDAKLAKRQICIAWVDLGNEFGSVHHNVIQFALRHYKIPFALQKIIFSYYSHRSAFILEPRTEPFNYGIGVFQGCTLSPVLFNVTFQLLLDSLASPALSALSYPFKAVDISVSNTAFADDLELLSNSASGCQKLLDVVDQFLMWTDCMHAALPKKCQSTASMQIDNRYVSFDPRLTISNTPITFLNSGEFKFLGRRLHGDCREVTQCEHLWSLPESLMATVDSSRLQGHQKLWLYHHLVVTKLS